jgi:hypothetical protein
LVHTRVPTQYARDEVGRLCLRNRCQQLATSQSAARSTAAHTNQTTSHQHRHTYRRSVRTQHTASGTVLLTSHQLSLLGKAFFQNRQHILNTHFLYHFAVYCLNRTITSPCTACTVQSLRRVLPLPYNHFTVYCLTVQSLQRVLPLL